MAVPEDLARKHAIVIDDTYVGTGGVSDFSVLLTRSAFADEVVDPAGAHCARSDGGDLRFSSDEAGTTQLACDVIAFAHDTSLGADDAAIQVRVKVPSIAGPAAGDTTIYVWYDGSTTTAQPAASDTYGSDNGYKAACLAYVPLNESSGNAADRTAAGLTCTLDAESYGAAGKVGPAVEFDGGADDGALPVNLSGSNKAIVEGWLYWDSFTNGYDIALEYTANGYSTDGGFYMCPDWGTGNLSVTLRVGGLRNTKLYTRPSGAAWHHYAIVADRANGVSLYIDGALATESSYPETATSGSGTLANSTLYLMSRGGASNFGAGRLQHLGVWSTRPAAEIATEYNQSATPALFAAPGTPEDVGGGTEHEIALTGLVTASVLTTPTIISTNITPLTGMVTGSVVPNIATSGNHTTNLTGLNTTNEVPVIAVVSDHVVTPNKLVTGAVLPIITGLHQHAVLPAGLVTASNVTNLALISELKVAPIGLVTTSALPTATIQHEHQANLTGIGTASELPVIDIQGAHQTILTGLETASSINSIPVNTDIRAVPYGLVTPSVLGVLSIETSVVVPETVLYLLTPITDTLALDVTRNDVITLNATITDTVALEPTL